MRTRRVFPVAILWLGACNAADAPSPTTVVRDSLGVRVTVTDAQAIEASDVFAQVADTLTRIGSPSDSPGAETLFQVAAARFLDGGSFVVLHGGNELRAYGADGSRQWVAGRGGRGPGEYSLANGLRRTPAGDIAVWDAQLARLSVVSPAGDFIRSQQLGLDEIIRHIPSINAIRPDSRWHLLDEGRLLVFDYSFENLPREGRIRPPLQYVAWRLDGTGADTLGGYFGIEQTSVPGSSGVIVLALDPEDTYFAASERSGHVYVGDAGQSHIDRYDQTGGADLRIEITSIDRTPDPERLATAKAALLEQLDRRGLASMESAVDVLGEGEDAPGFRGLATDDSDRVWVRWGQQPVEGQVTYAVFDSEGMFLGRALLPPHERILAIASDRILLLSRSALDIETVGLYRLSLDVGGQVP